MKKSRNFYRKSNYISVLMLKINESVTFKIIQVHAAKLASSEEALDDFYDSIEEVLNDELKRQSLLRQAYW